MSTLFGGSGATIVGAVFALGIVLVLISLVMWVVRLSASRALGGAHRRRLAVIESVAIDAKRRMTIVRRDDVEHVILTGGPQDVVVESQISAGAPPRAPSKRGDLASLRADREHAPEVDAPRVEREPIAPGLRHTAAPPESREVFPISPHATSR